VASHLAQVAKGVFLSGTWVTACLVLGQVVVSVLVLFLLFFLLCASGYILGGECFQDDCINLMYFSSNINQKFIYLFKKQLVLIVVQITTQIY